MIFKCWSTTGGTVACMHYCWLMCALLTRFFGEEIQVDVDATKLYAWRRQWQDRQWHWLDMMQFSERYCLTNHLFKLTLKLRWVRNYVEVVFMEMSWTLSDVPVSIISFDMLRFVAGWMAKVAENAIERRCHAIAGDVLNSLTRWCHPRFNQINILSGYAIDDPPLRE